MMNKKFKPLIALPPTEGFDYLQRMMFKKSEEEMSRKIPIIVIPEEAKELKDKVQSIANENGVEVSIIGLGDSGRSMKNMTMALTAMSMALTVTEQQKKDNILLIDDTEKQRGLKFSFNDLVKDVEPTIPFTGRVVSSKEQFLENKKPKKERVQNNRKNKKRKKAKNGR